MARARTIKPGYFTNELLAQCDPLARILFAGLWCLADKDGRLEDRPVRIKAAVLPYDMCDPDKLLDQLHTCGFILRYTVDGTRALQIAKWDKHARPHPNEASGELPEPPEEIVKLHECSCNSTAGCALSFNSNSNSCLTPLPPAGGASVSETTVQDLKPETAQDASEVEANPSQGHVGQKTARSLGNALPGFDDFWAAYPKRANKKDAVVAWRKIAPDQQTREKILASLEAQKRSREWTAEEGRYIPHPHRWLNKRRWEDEVAVVNTETPDQRTRRILGEHLDPKEYRGLVQGLARGVRQRRRAQHARRIAIVRPLARRVQGGQVHRIRGPRGGGAGAVQPPGVGGFP